MKEETASRCAPDSRRSLQEWNACLQGYLCRWLALFNAESAADCRQEVSILLWRLQDKLCTLPRGEQERYVVASVRHLVARMAQNELNRVARIHSFEDATATEGLSQEPSRQTDNVECLYYAKNWFDSISDPDLVNALRALKPDHYILIHCYYGQGLTDAEIAMHLDTTTSAVKVQRHRVLADLRRSVLRGGYPGNLDATERPDKNNFAECYLS